MTVMATRGTATIEYLMKTPKDGFKYELVDGEMLMSHESRRDAALRDRSENWQPHSGVSANASDWPGVQQRCGY